ncbi:MAG: hypothetical protein MUF27_15290 [Acidobacteria bacterium]|jgi:hypothetical protein|nr:hypothetical protein [Acidobacteriota bacterium]
MILAVGQSAPSGADREYVGSAFLTAIDAVLASDDEVRLELGRWKGVGPQRLIARPQDQSTSEPRLWQVRGQLRHWSMSKRLREALGRVTFEETQSDEMCPEGLRVTVWRGAEPAMEFYLGDDGSVCRLVSRTTTERLRPVGGGTDVLYEIALELISELVAGELSLRENCLEGPRPEQLQ